VANYCSPEDLIGTAVAISAFVRTIGGVVGFAINNSTRNSQAFQQVPTQVGTYTAKAGLLSSEVVRFVEVFTTSTEAAGRLPGVTPEILQAAAVGSQWGFRYAYRVVYEAKIPFGLVVVVARLFLPNISRVMTNKALKPTRRCTDRATTRLLVIFVRSSLE
jgi:hypothetical protein